MIPQNKTRNFKTNIQLILFFMNMIICCMINKEETKNNYKDKEFPAHRSSRYLLRTSCVSNPDFLNSESLDFNLSPDSPFVSSITIPTRA